MKKILAAVLGALVIGGIIAVVLVLRVDQPEALLRRMARGGSDHEEIVMRLNVARGDTVGPMIAALHDKTAPAAFRAEVVELLFKKNARALEDRIENVLVEALSYPEPEIRRKAAYNVVTFGDRRLRLALLNNIKDPDPQVRKEVYVLLCGDVGYENDVAEGILWKAMPAEQRERILQACLEQVKSETDPALLLLVHGVIGREIHIRCADAREAVQGSDLTGAEKVLRGATELDPTNPLGAIKLEKLYLANGDADKALAVGRTSHTLIEIPQLSAAPVLDGDPTDAVWREAYTTDKFYSTVSPWSARPIKGHSVAWIGHRDGTLYVAVAAYEPDLGKILRAFRGRDSAVPRDDSAEIILDPESTGKDYYQFIINANAAIFDQYNGQRAKNFLCQGNAALFPDRGYWAVEFAINGKDLDNHLIKSGTIWSMNVYSVRLGGSSEHGCISPAYGSSRRTEVFPLAVFK